MPIRAGQPVAFSLLSSWARCRSGPVNLWPLACSLAGQGCRSGPVNLWPLACSLAGQGCRSGPVTLWPLACSLAVHCARCRSGPVTMWPLAFELFTKETPHPDENGWQINTIHKGSVQPFICTMYILYIKSFTTFFVSSAISYVFFDLGDNDHKLK